MSNYSGANMPSSYRLLARRAAALAILAAPALAQSARFDPERSPELEFRYAATGQPLVRAALDGLDLGWFIFDTGSSQHVIDADLSQLMRLEEAGSVVSVSPSGEVEARRVRVNKLVLGPATFRNQRFTEYDMSFLASFMGDGVVGVIGADVFSECIIEIEYARGRIALHDPRTFKRGGLDWSRLTLKDRTPCVRVAFEGHEETFLVDTGYDGGALIFTPTVGRLDLLEHRATRQVAASNITGSVTYRSGQLAWFELAGHRWNRTETQFSLLPSGAHATKLPAGIVGCRYLVPFTMFLDCGRRRVAFREQAEAELDARQLAACRGVFRDADGRESKVVQQGGKLLLERPGQRSVRLRPASATEFFGEDTLLSIRFEAPGGGAFTRLVTTTFGEPAVTADRKTRSR